MNISGKKINFISGTQGWLLTERLKEVCEINTIDDNLTEFDLGLHSAEIFGDGILALSGTGCTIFAKHGENIRRVGGLGSMLYDAGAGYHIGRAACKAAIEHDLGFGEPTIITDLITDQLKRDCSADSVKIPSIQGFQLLLYSIYANKNISPVVYISSFTKLVSMAASLGDKVATKILEEAGRIVGLQTCSLISINSMPNNLPLTISGSVWKSHKSFYNSFRDTIKDSLIGELIPPYFEPIVGVIIRHYYKTHGKYDDDSHNHFAQQFGKFKFDFAKE